MRFLCIHSDNCVAIEAKSAIDARLASASTLHTLPDRVNAIRAEDVHLWAECYRGLVQDMDAFANAEANPSLQESLYSYLRPRPPARA